MLALKWLHVSCDVSICMARAYLEAVWNCGDRHVAAGSMLGTLVYGAVVGIGFGSTLGDGAVVGVVDGTTLGYGAVVGIGDGLIGGDVVGVLLGKYDASIPCRFLMACICSFPTANRDAGTGFLSASTRYSTDWGAASVDKNLGLGSYTGKSNCLDYPIHSCVWDINGVAVYRVALILLEVAP